MEHKKLSDAHEQNFVGINAQKRSSVSGLLLCFISAGLFALSILTSKLVYQYNISPLLFSCVRAAFCALICLIFVTVRGGSLLIPPPARQYVLPMSIMLLMVSFGYPLAMKYIPASLASLLFYLWPILVLFFSTIEERKIPGFQQIIIFSAAFVGLGLAFSPSADALNWIGVSAAITAAIGASLFFIFIPKITRYADSLTINININIIAGLVLLGCTVINGDIRTPSDTAGWYILAFAGVLYGLAMVLIFYAVSSTGPKASSVLFNTEPLIVIVLAAVFFSEILDSSQYLGVFIVLIAMILAGIRTVKN